MIKTFEEFNGEMLCESKSKIIENEFIYSDNPEYQDREGICKTWDEVLKLFSHPKYNVQCAIYTDREWRKWDDNVLDTIKDITKDCKYKLIEIYEGGVSIEVYNKSEHNIDYAVWIYPLNGNGISRKKKTYWYSFDEISKLIFKIEYDIFDDYNIRENKYIQKIKSVSSKEDINKILDNAFKSTTREQYSIILSAALCREIELGIWEPTYNGETIIQDLTDRFNFEYFTEN